MNRRPLPDAIPISLLNAYVYCPRRFFYEFVEGDMLANEFVLEGAWQHERVDTPAQRMARDGDLQITRVHLFSERLRLTGIADLIETHDNTLVPVEYKHGKEGRWINDHVQLCAQALCLEERHPQYAPLACGEIFYFGSRKRVQVRFTEELRVLTQATIDAALAVAISATPPTPLTGPQAARCRDCSLRSLCLPDEVLLLQAQGGSDDHIISD